MGHLMQRPRARIWFSPRGILTLAAGLLAACAFTATAAPLAVRVETINGVPRWMVNGRPQGARVFWGAPGPSQIPVSTSAQRVSFEFVALGSATNATLHFRFGQTPGEVDLDNIQVTDLTAQSVVAPRCDFESGPKSFERDWTFWPPGTANTVGTVTVAANAGDHGSAALRISLKAPSDGVWPDFHIYHHPNLVLLEGHRYRVSFWAQARPARALTVALYQPGAPFIFLGGPSGAFIRQIQLAAEAGVNFVSFPIGLPWPRPGEPADWHGPDIACKAVLSANPRALLLPRIPMDPPAWWRQAHPAYQMEWEKGRRDKAVVASPQYRQDAARQLTALVEHLESEFGDHIAGYHPCGQNTGEWFYESSWEAPISGYAPADIAAWRQWLKQRYRTDAALQRAWSSTTTFDSAPVPSPAARHGSPAGIFRDPLAERPLIDFAEFQQRAMADCVCTLAHAVRVASQGRKLVLFFYGYGFEFGALPNGPAVSGHYALRRVLDCPDIDVLCSPISYFDRGLGGTAPAMSAAESVALAHKMWLNEDDTHTYLASGNPPGAQAHVTTVAGTNRELLRSLAQAACRHFGTWWMDLGATGWFNDPRLWLQMARMNSVDQAFLTQPVPFRPEVAAVLDERSMCWLAADGARVTRPGIYEARAALGRMGAPYGQYLLDDVLAGRVRAKLFVFLNAWNLSAEQRTRLAKATRGATCLWSYASGYFDGDRSSFQAMRQLTGFTFKSAEAQPAWATPTAAGRRLSLQQAFGVHDQIRPLLAVAADDDDEVLATYPDGATAVALRRGREGVSLFVGVPRITSELLRLAAREARVHLFAQTDCSVYANGPFLALHATEAGPVEVDTGKAGVITDAFTGEAVGQGPRFPLPLRRGDTRVLRY